MSTKIFYSKSFEDQSHLLLSIVNSIKEAVIVVDLGFKIIFRNKVADSLFGIGLGELVEEGLSSLGGINLPEFSEKRGLLHIVGTCQDIAELKETENVLELSRMELCQFIAEQEKIRERNASTLHPDDHARLIGELQMHLDNRSERFSNEHRVMVMNGLLT